MMKKLYTAFFLFFYIFANNLHALDLTVKEVFNLGPNGQTLITFEGDNQWIVLKPRLNWFCTGYTVEVESEDPQPGQCYYFLFTTENWDLELTYHRFLGMKLPSAAVLSDDQPGSLTHHTIIEKLSIPGEFSLEEGIIQLDDGRIWFIPNYQNTFKVGDEVSTFTETEDLIYLIKTIKIGDDTKEIFIPSQRITRGVFRVY